MPQPFGHTLAWPACFILAAQFIQIQCIPAAAARGQQRRADLSKRRLESRTWMQAAPLDVFAARGVPVDGAVVAAAQRSGDALRRFGRLEEAVVLEEAASGV